MIYLITLNNFVNFKHINPPNGGFFIAYSLLVFLKITKHKQQSQIIKEHWKCCANIITQTHSEVNIEEKQYAINR